MASTAPLPGSGLSRRIADYAPGVLVAATVAVAAKFLSEHYGAPAMLMALLLGIALNFLTEEGKCAAGINFTAR
ncbi:putative sulfate exporter family transporter, partial [Aurantimonas sp. C2-4-R8]|nr:putative sulfate exporter family transporter [Aurantimonas sp. C2-4-R8]